MKHSYRDYRPFINSTLFGSLFVWAGIAMDKDKYNESLIALLVFFVPIIYSLITNYFEKKSKRNSIYFLITSCMIYLLAVYSYFFNDHTYHLIFLGTFLSSLLYELLKRYFFEINVSLMIIIIIAILSSLSFIPFQLVKWNKTYFGLGIFLWMIINSIIPKITFKNNIF